MYEEFLSYLQGQGKSQNTVMAYSRNAKQYLSWCVESFGKEPDKQYRANLLDYIAYMRNIKKYGPRTVNIHLTALRCLNDFLILTGQ